MWLLRFPFTTLEVASGLEIDIDEVYLNILSGALQEYCTFSTINLPAEGHHTYIDILRFSTKRELNKSSASMELEVHKVLNVLTEIEELDILMRSASMQADSIGWLSDQLLRKIECKNFRHERTSMNSERSSVETTRGVAKALLSSYDFFISTYISKVGQARRA